MTTSILRPNATVIDDLDWARTGGATKHGVLSDDSDATYIAATSPSAAAADGYGFGTVALPAGAVTKTIQFRVRGRLATGSLSDAENLTFVVPSLGDGPSGGDEPLTSGVIPINGTGETTYSAAPVAISIPQADIDGLEAYISAQPTTNALRVLELYLNLIYALVPVANVTYPTGTPAITTTNKPIYTWTHTPGSDGGVQTFYEVKVYTAAQYGAGGFDPDTSTPFYTSGVTVGAATSHTSGVLTNSTTYRVYVRTAQTINGTAQWSAWDFEGFSIAVTTSDVSAITATPQGDARILVAVDRSGSAWDFIEVQRSTDAGTTWEYVRGGEYVNPATTTLYSTGDANNFDINDWEVPNGTPVLYRARATRIVSLLPITGAWVQSTPAVAWTSAGIWLKAPDEPALNRTVDFQLVPDATFPRRQGVFPVLNTPNPIVVSDVLSGGSGALMLQTANDTEMRDLFALLRKPVLLLHPTPGWVIGPQYIAPGSVSQIPLSTRVVLPQRRFEVGYHQVDASADALAGSP